VYLQVLQRGAMVALSGRAAVAFAVVHDTIVQIDGCATPDFVWARPSAGWRFGPRSGRVGNYTDRSPERSEDVGADVAEGRPGRGSQVWRGREMVGGPDDDAGLGSASDERCDAGTVSHPLSGEDTVAFVARGGTAKLCYLRRRPTLHFGFPGRQEVGVCRGAVGAASPDDRLPGFDRRSLATAEHHLRRSWGPTPRSGEFDRGITAERRAAVLLKPQLVVTNPVATEHQEH
jgi:hypothetical protein